MLSTTAHAPVVLSESRCALARLQPVFNLSACAAAFASKFRLGRSSKKAREPIGLAPSNPCSRPLGAPPLVSCLFHILKKVSFTFWSGAIVAEQAERSCPAPPALRHRSHRFDSVLKAGSASTMEARGKTITPAGLRNVNLHTRLFCLPPTVFHRWRGDGGQRVAVGCFPMEHTGVFIGESCCLSLLSLSKATYLTPPLQCS